MYWIGFILLITPSIRVNHPKNGSFRRFSSPTKNRPTWCVVYHHDNRLTMRPQPIDAFIMMSTNMMDVIIGNSGGVEGSNSIISYGHGKKVLGARGHLEKNDKEIWRIRHSGHVQFTSSILFQQPSLLQRHIILRMILRTQIIHSESNFVHPFGTINI